MITRLMKRIFLSTLLAFAVTVGIWFFLPDSTYIETAFKWLLIGYLSAFIFFYLLLLFTEKVLNEHEK